MSRAKRTTKKQKEYIIQFLEDNKVLLGGKINPIHLPTVNEIWGQFAAALNEIGPPKTIKQWKDAISEIKTTTKRRTRDVKYGQQRTGGGAPVKPLTDLAEKLLGLLSKVTVEGADLIEAGGRTAALIAENVAGPSTEQIEDEVYPNPQLFLENVPNIEFEVIEANGNGNTEEKENENVRMPKKNKKIIRKKLRPRDSHVERAITAHDRHLLGLSASNLEIASAIRSLAKAVNRLASKKY